MTRIGHRRRDEDLELRHPGVAADAHAGRPRARPRAAKAAANSNYLYALTQKGLDRADAALGRSGYVGPAPVPLADYIARVRAQTRRRRRAQPRRSSAPSRRWCSQRKRSRASAAPHRRASRCCSTGLRATGRRRPCARSAMRSAARCTSRTRSRWSGRSSTSTIRRSTSCCPKRSTDDLAVAAAAARRPALGAHPPPGDLGRRRADARQPGADVRREHEGLRSAACSSRPTAAR